MYTGKSMNIESIVKHFDVTGTVIGIESRNNGHINETYTVLTDRWQKYILQRINTHVFPDVDGLMKNINVVTDYLKKVIADEKGEPDRETLSIVHALDGKLYYMEDGAYWRMYYCIDNARSYQKVENPRQFYESAKAFGVFQRRLSGFDASRLNETIKDFHNTPVRYSQFINAYKENVANRADLCRKEYEFITEREPYYNRIESLLEQNLIPKRVAHNDTKLNNVMFDCETDKAIAVIDLDTVMPSTLLYDFGDAIRYGCNTATEETEDLNKVNFDINLFEVFAKGFLEGTEENLTDTEKQYLGYASWLMTMECGIRFLTDYLNGDIYFRIEKENDNLVRCRTQFKLAEEMEKNKAKMDEIIMRLSK